MNYENNNRLIYFVCVSNVRIGITSLETRDFDVKLYTRGNICLRLSSNSEAFAPELLDNFGKMFECSNTHWYIIRCERVFFVYMIYYFVNPNINLIVTYINEY